jgi:hypothetical protein
MKQGPLDALPLWALFLVNVAFVLISIEVGYRIGRRGRERSVSDKPQPIGSIVTATLGLLAFLLTYTFGLGATRFDARRHVLIDEANAVKTAFLRADVLPGPERAEVRRLLIDYVDVRLSALRSGLPRAVARSEELHDEMWRHAIAAADRSPGSIPVGLLMQSLNDVIEMHTRRVALVLRGRIYGAIWIALYVVAFSSMGVMGYYMGLHRTGRSIATLALALSFSSVMWLIADLDRPLEGAIQVSFEAMRDLEDFMKTRAGS